MTPGHQNFSIPSAPDTILIGRTHDPPQLLLGTESTRSMRKKNKRKKKKEEDDEEEKKIARSTPENRRTPQDHIPSDNEYDDDLHKFM